MFSWEPLVASAVTLQPLSPALASSTSAIALPTGMSACPALKKALVEIDTDGDGAISADEIAQRVQSYVDDRLGRMTLACAVLVDGVPLSGATVTFLPEPFLGDAIPPATGTTGSTGIAAMVNADVSPPGITVGFFKVLISKKDASGNELIPARYNVATQLGQEIALGSRALSMGPIKFQLSSN